MTRQESRLWYDFLRLYSVRFQRQKIIYHYIADFYCSSAKLIIELDGHQHEGADAKEYDRIRTQAFEGAGITVLRFKNDEITNDFRFVCQTIDQTIQQRLCEIPLAPS